MSSYFNCVRIQSVDGVLYLNIKRFEQGQDGMQSALFAKMLSEYAAEDNQYTD